jgi:ParB family chromosome partitioning protein
VVREVSDDDMLLIGLIENIQREDLNAIELATSYQRLIDTFGWTQEALSEQVGKKRATVANTLRLLHLPETVQQALSQDFITMGHARAILAIEGEEAQADACRQVIEKGLSVRQAEQLAKPKQPRASKPAKDPNLTSIEDDLRRKLGTKVHLKNGPKNRGKIEIEYYSLDDLERLLDLIKSAR